MSNQSYSFPTSFGQQRLWILDQLVPGSPFYNIPVAVPIETSLDMKILQRAVNEIVARHEVLRTTFAVKDGAPIQSVVSNLYIPIAVSDLTTLPEAERELEAVGLASKEAATPFELSKGPLIRVGVLHLGWHKHILMVTMHHTISDGWSMNLFWRELAALYTAFAAGRASPLPKLPIQYADYAVWQREWLSGNALETQVRYWREQLVNLPTLTIPTDRLRSAVQTFRGATAAVVIPAALTQRLKALSQREEVTLFITVLAAFKVLLQRYSGQDDIVVGCPIAGRNRAEIENLIGFFVNMLVLRTTLAGDPSFRELLQRERSVVLEAFANQDVPFEMLVDELRPDRDLSRNPLFQVSFQLSADAQPAGSFGTADPWLDIKRGTAIFDLAFSFWETGGTLRGSIEYSTDLFDSDTIARISTHLIRLLEHAALNPDCPISGLSLVTPEEQRRQLRAWNDTETAAPEFVVHESFTMQAGHCPETIAVRCGDHGITYRELDRRTNQLAHVLQGLGVVPGVRVGLCFERSIEMVVAMLGVLKAEGGYLPLDPNYPDQRLSFMAEDAAIKVLLTMEQFRSCLRTEAACVCLDVDHDRIACMPSESPRTHSSPEHVAYVIYTSGSTGHPKGVLVPHRAVANHMAWMLAAFPLTQDDRVLQRTPFSFDASVWEFFAPLQAGARLVLHSQCPASDTQALVKTLRTEGITTLQMVPSLLRLLVDEPSFENCTSLRRVFSGGEPLSVDLAARFRSRCSAELINLYGPTEGTIDATFHRFNPSEAGNLVPIGRPISNVRAYVLDEQLQAVPPNVSGELYLGGKCLALGYLNRPELDAERFITDPHSNEPDARLYRTGDWVRQRSDGIIEFIGRKDHQVKLGGFRIDLAEIEVVLREHPVIANAFVVMQGEDADGSRLVAYLTVKAGIPIPTAVELRAYLRRKLPEAMIPAAFVPLEALPLMPNGKIDHSHLPPVDGKRLDLKISYTAPETPLQQLLVGYLKQLLSIDRVGIHDNFFDLGGHSLLAARLIARIRDELQVEHSLLALFEAPTVAGIVEALTADPSKCKHIEEFAELLLTLEGLPDEEVDAMLAEYKMPVPRRVQ